MTRAAEGRWSVRLHLLVFAVVTLLLYAVTVVYSYADTRRDARRTARTDLAFQARLVRDAFNASVSADAVRTVAALAATPGIAGFLAAPQQCHLSAGAVGVFPTSHIDLVAPDGSLICTSVAGFVGGARVSYAKLPWWNSVTPTPAVAPPYADPMLAGVPAVAVAGLIVDRGAVAGAVVLGLPLRGVADRAAATYGGPRGVRFAIIDSDGHVPSAPQATSSRWSSPAVASRFRDHSTGVWAGGDGLDRMWASAPIGLLRGRVYGGIDLGRVDAIATRELRHQAGFAVAALLLIATVVALAYRQIVRPLQAVTAAIVRAGQEPSPSGVEVRGPAEIGQLASEFNVMLRARLEYERRMVHQALHDTLTGLPNRTLVTDRLDQALAKAKAGGTVVAVLLVDVDRFKTINDAFGHDAGDKVLLEITHRLRDAPGPTDTVGRFDSDTFVIVCEGLETPDAALAVAERVRASFDDPFVANGTEVALTAAIGVAVAHPTSTAEPLLRDADTALERAKGDDSSGVQIFDIVLRERAERRRELETGLGLALASRQLAVAYQPVVNILSGQIVGMEALVRWRHPVHGNVAPLEFIPLAEETGQVVAVGRYVLAEACRQAAVWNELGHTLRMSVNVSARQLTRGDLVDSVGRCLARHELEPSQLCLELTETALLRTTGEGARTLKALYDRGVHVSLDDFGTGYSSLSYLQQLPVTSMKIDRSFVERLDRDPAATEFVAAIMGLARALHLGVVAEGVESDEQLEVLKAYGCELVQGYLFARPATPDTLTTALEKGGVVYPAPRRRTPAARRTPSRRRP